MDSFLCGKYDLNKWIGVPVTALFFFFLSSHSKQGDKDPTTQGVVECKGIWEDVTEEGKKEKKKEQ